MDAVHLHLLLNHIPILGVLFGLIILAIGFFSKNQTVEHVGLITLVLVTLLTIPTYLTGEEAEHSVEKLSGISEHFLEEHEELSEIGLWIMIGTGVLALLSFFFSKIKSRIGALNGVTLLASIITFVMMVIIGNHGGKIRHTELHDSDYELVDPSLKRVDHDD